MKSTKYYMTIAFTPPFLIGVVFASILVLHGEPGRRDWLGGLSVLSLTTGFGSVAMMPLAASKMASDYKK